MLPDYTDYRKWCGQRSKDGRRSLNHTLLRIPRFLEEHRYAKQARAGCGYSRADLSRLMGVRPSYLGKLLSTRSDTRRWLNSWLAVLQWKVVRRQGREWFVRF